MPSTSSHGATNSTLQPSVPALTPAQMYSNFEEWIKLCTDNVIHKKDTIFNFILNPSLLFFYRK